MSSSPITHRTIGGAAQRAVILAPHHADFDLRVRRTIDVISRLYSWTDVFWDRDYPGHAFKELLGSALGKEHYVERKPLRLLRSACGLQSLPAQARQAIASCSVVYIHASGIEGLIYAREARRYNAQAWIVFDYHDSIPYELFYQLKKRRLQHAFRVCWTIYRRLLLLFARSFDAVVGISANQLKELEAITGRRCPQAVVPNVRHFTWFFQPESRVSPTTVSLVWLGQVMRGRDLERLAEWMQRLEQEVCLHVYGKVIDERAKTDLERTLGPRAVFYGPYSGDGAIARLLPAGGIGVYFGWEDPANTGINKIASPNKYFTYVNLELPVILDASLEGLTPELLSFRAGVAVTNVAEFVSAVSAIGSDYTAYYLGMRNLKAKYMGISPDDALRQLLINHSPVRQGRGMAQGPL